MLIRELFNLFLFPILFLIIFTVLFKTNLYFCDKDIKTEKSKKISSSDNLLKNVLQHSPKISEEEIEEGELKIIEQAHEEEFETAKKLHMCIKDYEAVCPKHWKKIEMDDKILCQAEFNYNGFCEVIQSFENFTEDEKINFETSCNVEWPCKNEITESCKNGRNYMEPCPEGFILQNDHSCKADITKYSGYCISNNINFTHMTTEEKEKWSEVCEAFWPCYEECEGNEILSNCPKYWKQEKNSYECTPTENYDGPCKNKKAFTYFTKKMKKEFEEKCKTTFECIKKDCEIDYDKNCPENWIEENGTCIAPSSFSLCDRKKLSIESTTTVNEKKKFEKECSVNWPCKETCEMEWNLSCPDGWTQKDKLENMDSVSDVDTSYTEKDDVFFCEPPTFYKGKCNHIVLHKDSNENTKRELASSCDAPWSCINKKGDSIKPKKDKMDLQGDVESGPITSSGKIFRSSKYDISDDEPSSLHDIMQ